MITQVRVGLHLAKRFVTSLSPRPPTATDEAWARSHLVAGELEIWDRMSNPDRRHAVGVAREVVERWPSDLASAYGPEADRAVVAAALMHDCGKVDSGLGTFARVGATLFWAVVDTDRADVWLDGNVGGIRGRLARYRKHPERGSQMLAAAGAAPLTSAWAAEHHRSAASWSVAPEIGELLKACDDD